jgi:hypothetical protein
VVQVLGHPVLIVELACQFSDRSADRLLILAQLEVHNALRSMTMPGKLGSLLESY